MTLLGEAEGNLGYRDPSFDGHSFFSSNFLFRFFFFFFFFFFVLSYLFYYYIFYFLFFGLCLRRHKETKWSYTYPQSTTGTI